MNTEDVLQPRRWLGWLMQAIALGAIATVAVLMGTLRPATWEQLRAFDRRWLPVLFAMVLVAWLCNGTRVWLLCRALGYRLRFRQAITVSLSQEFGVAATPAGLGGAVIRLALLRRAGVPLAASASMLASDAAIDLLFFVLLTPAAIGVLFHDDVFGHLLARTGFSPRLAALLGGLAALVMGAGLRRRAAFHRGIHRLLGWTTWGRRHRWPARHRYFRIRVSMTLRRMRAALAILWGRRRGVLVLNFLLAGLQWSCRYGLLPLVLLAVHVRVNPLPLFLAQGLLFMLALLVVAPGGGGAVELLTALILPVFVPVSLVGIVVLVWRFFSYHLYLVGGGAAFWIAFRAGNAGIRADPPPRAEPRG